MLKRGTVIFGGLIAFFILINTVYAQVNNCPPDQTILSLYTSNNSHGAVWDTADATYKICYSDIYGYEYTGLNPRTCIGNSNTVLKLYTTTDSHAESPTMTNYPNNICYGTMSCTLRTGSCNFGEKIVVRLAGETNSHISNASYTPYSKLICCSEKPLGFNNVYWTTPQNNIINTAAVRDRVNMSVITNFSTGAVVTFEIFENDKNEGGTIQNIRIGTKAITAIIDSNGIASANWTILSSDITAGASYDTLNTDTLEFYFRARYGGYEVNSSILQTSKVAGTLGTGGDCSLGIATKVTDRGIYFANTSLEFNSTRTGQGIPLNWKVEEDGIITKTVNADSFIINFSNPGQKTITVNGNIEGCAQQYAEVSILVIGSPGIFVYINEPSAGKIYSFGNSNSLGITYSAGNSYVINSELVSGQPCQRTITCLAGNCPPSTSGMPAECSGSGISLSGSTNQGFSNVNFTWNEIKGSTNLAPFFSEKGIFSKTLTYFRSDKSNNLNDKKVRVIANYTNNGISLQKSFTRSFTLGLCLEGGTKVVNLDAYGKLTNLSSTISSINNANAPFNPDACSSTTDGICCPVGYSCLSGQGCVLSEDIPTSCSDYTTKTACEGDPYRDFAAQSDFSRIYPDIGASCLTQFSCVYDGTSCQLNASEVDVSGNVVRSCVQQATATTQCTGDALTQTLDVIATPSNAQASCLPCDSKTYEVPCGRPGVALPFYGFYQFILSVLGIIFAYIIIFRGKIIKTSKI